MSNTAIENITNYYQHCEVTWELHNCCSAHNDKCPECDKEIEPTSSSSPSGESVKIFVVKYPGSYLGGNAVVIADSKKIAWKLLKKENPLLDDFYRCTFTEKLYVSGVIYNWDGDC